VTIQTERMLKELGATNRRAFQRREDAEEWLGEVCSSAERGRLRQFLDDGE
jgi:hypothetical protein